VPDSPAAQAGLQQGDEIVSVDGQALDADHNLTDLITSHAPGDQVALEVVQSGGETVTMNVILGQNPDSEGVAYLGVQYTASPRFDLPMNGIMPLPNPGDYQFNQMPFFPPDGRVSQGVIVRGVTAGSPADSAGLKQGDVIAAVDGEPVSSPQALSDAVSGHEPGDRITLTVYRSSDQQVVTIDVTLGPHPDQEGRAYLGVSIGGFFHIQQPGEDDGSGGFELYGQPFDWPFGQDGAPFQFQLPLPPDGSSCNGSPACAGKSA
jgi:serine protease Do